MLGALLPLVAFVLSGFAPAGQATWTEASTCAGATLLESAACDAAEGDDTESLASGWGDLYVRAQRQELATPAEIGCALVFRNTAAVDHTARLHVPSTSSADVHLWSCDESALRVFNAWYRVSRFPESESPRALSWQATEPLAHFTQTDRTVTTNGRGAAVSQAQTNQRGTDQSVSSSARLGEGAALFPPPARNLSVRATKHVLVNRPLATPDRPPRVSAA